MVIERGNAISLLGFHWFLALYSTQHVMCNDNDSFGIISAKRDYRINAERLFGTKLSARGLSVFSSTICTNQMLF